MTVSRIPPIQCLLTFEAVARLRSASRAAEDLCVTVSAVSHRLRQLESHLGVRLFSRSDFTPTAEGAVYLQQVGIALAALRELPSERAPRGTPRLRVAVTPSFCRQFVMPKLELFRRDWPDIELTLQVSIPLRDVIAEEAELEIRYGAGGYADLEHRLLLRDDVVPACSPAFLDEHGPFDGFASLAECAGTALVRSPLEPWSNWFAHCGLALPEPARGAQFNDLGLAYDAAAGGFGVALVRQRLGAAWFDSGRLLALSSRPLRSPYAHYLCWRPGALERWECAAFADWLQAVLP